MGAAFHHAALVENDDLVYLLEPCQPVGDEQGGLAFGQPE
jgi:hypothetical protein